ncbi:hypothetical protein [Cloacibacterium sp.]|uniref:hypothetical protein n=1 Tax=Cloacibacterium sp. TaxID=1913682 RepID=UPI0039E5D6F1
MKTILKIILLIFFSGTCHSQENEKKIKTYVDFLEKQNTSAKDYILNLFKNHDVVILTERHHGDIEQYNLFLSIISDPYFIKNIGAVYTEVGVTNKRDDINRFLNSSRLSNSEMKQKVIELYQSIDYNHLWTYYSFPWLLEQLYTLNQNNKKDKVNLYPCDLAFDWKDVNTIEEYNRFDKSEELKKRDSIMAKIFLNQFNEIQKKRNNKKKALVIMNTRHGYLKDTHYSEKEIRNNFGRYLQEQLGQKVASVYLMGMGHPSNWKDYTVIKDGTWDYAFESTNRTDTGFNLKQTPFGMETFDATPNGWITDKLLYQDVFTGIVFYKPIEMHIKKTGWENVLTPDFVPEIRRRLKLMGYNEQETEEMVDFYQDVKTSSCYYNLEQERKRIDQWKSVMTK